METINNNFNRLISILIFMGVIVLWVAPVAAMEPTWKDVSQSLKKEEGIEHKGKFLFATGEAIIEKIRPDKAHELAKKKSLLRALQLVHMASSCKNAPAGLDSKEYGRFIRLFALLTPPLRVQGITVIRQWETDQSHFTAVAVPLSAIENVPCEFPDLSTAIEQYIKIEQPSIEGLAFCLRHIPRYSNLNREIRNRIGKWFQDNEQKELALCFIPELETLSVKSQLETLVFQNYLFRAIQLTEKAEKQAEQGQWEEALINASESLKMAPAYGRSYLVFTDFFLLEWKKPVFALCAAEKAMRAGTCFKEALSRKVSILKTLGSPEADIYQFLLAQSKALPDWEFYSFSEACPDAWTPEIKKMAGKRIVNLVAFSLGQAIQGNPKPPDSEFGQAVTLFNQTKNDQDVNRVLDLLFSACEKQPASPKTYNLIGACYRHLGKYEMALPFLWQTLTLEPEYDFALTNLALCCRSLGLEESARYYFEHDAVKDSKNKWVKESYAEFKNILGHR